MKKSLMKQVAKLLSVILFVNGIVFITIAFFVGTRAKKINLEENRNLSTIYANNIETRLNVGYEHIYNIAIDIFDMHGVYETSTELDYLGIKKICDEMDKKLLVSSDVDVLFAYDTVLDQKILRASAYTNFNEIVAIKQEIYEYSKEHCSAINESNWTVVTINNNDYFYNAIQIGKYRVGMLSNIKNYGKDTFSNLIGGFSATFVKFNNSLYLISGDGSLSSCVDGENNGYLVTETTSSSKLIRLASVALPNANGWHIETIVFLLIIESIVSILLIIALYRFTKRCIRYPLEELIVANEQVAMGNLDYRLDVNKVDSVEFNNIYQSYNDMVAQIGELKINQYELQLQEERNRLRMLRAQVKPHTFLNGITTISNMTYTQPPEKIRDYINAYAKFTRYMLHTSSEMTTISKEIQHVENYVELQRKKSAVNIELNILCKEDVENCEMPFLMLYSLVENSFKHSLISSKDMAIYIQCKRIERDDFKGIMIVEEDNGKGFTDEKLEQLNELEVHDEYAKEHLGLTNIKYTLKLLYKRNDLLEISNSLDGGARIVILIPEEEDKNETINM